MPSAIAKDRHAILSAIIGGVLNAGVIPHYCIVRKDRLRPHWKKAPYGIVYNWLTGNLLCGVYKDRFNGPITLVVDRRSKETHGHMAFDGYLKTRLIGDCEHAHEFHIRHEDSQEWLGLQAVDLISWGLFRHYEHGDSRFRAIVKPCVGICETWI